MKERFESTAADDGAPTRRCERAEDLVVYLYGEASVEEARSFEQHAGGCAACRDELSAFGAVREAVGAWRAEAFNAPLSLASVHAFASETDACPAAVRNRSALAAVREFFALAPLWLRAGATAAAVMMCVLTVLSFAQTEIRWDGAGIALRTNPGRERAATPTAEVDAPETFTRAQVDEMIKDEVERARAEQQASTEGPSVSRARRVSPAAVATVGEHSNVIRPAPNISLQRVAKRATPHLHNTSRGSIQVAGVEEEERPTSLYDLLRAVN